MDRTQTVRVDGKLNDEKRVISGIPQGTILGPLLFILFISPMSNILQCSMISSFADDTKIIAPRSANLQKDLNDIYDWVHSNNMEFNGSKFRVVAYGGGDRSNLKDPLGNPIEEVETVRDLGVIIESLGKYDAHIMRKYPKPPK